jgi:hypothetical protein
MVRFGRVLCKVGENEREGRESRWCVGSDERSSS